jgi:hypothetical protein
MYRVKVVASQRSTDYADVRRFEEEGIRSESGGAGGAVKYAAHFTG